MITYTPEDCSKEFEKIYCKSITITRKTCYLVSQQISYNNVKYIHIRRYNRLEPMIMIVAQFEDGILINEYDISQCVIYQNNIRPSSKKKHCLFSCIV